MGELTTIQMVAIIALPFILAITVHEAAHGLIADRLGDHTARSLGRVTLNPLKHIDPLGTVILPLALFALGLIPIGWAKPVPIDGRNLKRPRKDMAWVAAAGPGANLIMGVLWGLVILAEDSLYGLSPWVAEPLVFMAAAGVWINVILFVLNMLPIPPLDGSRVVASLLPAAAARSYGKIEPYGLFIVLGLIAVGILQRIILPLAIYIVLLMPGGAAVLPMIFK